MSVVNDDIEPLSFIFEDDGLVPNNPMPLLVYKQAIAVGNGHPEKTIEGLFGANGWGEMWRNGVYDYLHYHATVHEALGVARGRARVRFGGDAGKEIEIAAGKSHKIKITALQFGFRGVAKRAYWTEPGDYKLSASFVTAINPAPKGVKADEQGFGRVTITSPKIALKVEK